MASSSFDDALASTRRLLTDLAALRSQLLLSTTTGSNAAAHQSLNSIVDDLAAIARSGADSAADVDGEVLQHLSRPEGSHPDLLLLSKLGDAMMVWRQQAASTTGAAEATGDAPPPAAAVRDWLEREGLASAAARIFEREDDGSGDVEVDTDAVDCERPRDLPSSHVQLLRGAISDVALREVLLAAAENHSALSAAAVAPFHGRPRVRFTDAQLARSFDLIPPPPAAPTGAAAKGGARAGAPGAGIAAVSSSASGIAASASAAPPPAADPLAAVIASWNWDAQTLAELAAAANAEALLPAWSALRAMSWSAWPLNGGNPFVFKITAANAKKAGVPHYLSVIATPMDLTRMKERIDKGAYGSPAEFLADARLMVANAKLFNCPATWRPTAPGYFPRPEEVASKRPAEMAAAPVYGWAWEMGAAIDAAAPGVEAAWTAAVGRGKRAIVEAVVAMQRQQQRQQQGQR